MCAVILSPWLESTHTHITKKQTRAHTQPSLPSYSVTDQHRQVMPSVSGRARAHVNNLYITRCPATVVVVAVAVATPFWGLSGPLKATDARACSGVIKGVVSVIFQRRLPTRKRHASLVYSATCSAAAKNFISEHPSVLSKQHSGCFPCNQ